MALRKGAGLLYALRKNTCVVPRKRCWTGLERTLLEARAPPAASTGMASIACMRASIAGLTGLAGLTRLASLTSLAGLTRLARLAGTSANGVRALCGASLTGTRDAYPRGGSRWPHARRAETNVEVELVDRLRAPRRNVVDCGIAIDADPRSFQAGKWRLISGHRLRMQDVRDQELGVIVKPGGQIETLIGAGPNRA
jgi:hypothetical protein